MYRLLQYCMFLILFVGLVGCSSGKMIRRGSLEESVDKKIVKVVRLSKIIGLTLKDLTPVFFSEDGANINLVDSSISGNNIENVFKTYYWRDIKFVKVKQIDKGPQFIYPANIYTVWNDAKTKIVTKIKKDESYCWDFVEFDKTGGEYNAVSGEITGRSKKGTELTLSAVEVYYLNAKKCGDGLNVFKFSIPKLGRLFLTIGALAGFTYGFIEITK